MADDPPPFLATTPITKGQLKRQCPSGPTMLPSRECNALALAVLDLKLQCADTAHR
jgi:hypothetical protein